MQSVREESVSERHGDGIRVTGFICDSRDLSETCIKIATAKQILYPATLTTFSDSTFSFAYFSNSWRVRATEESDAHNTVNTGMGSTRIRIRIHKHVTQRVD